MQRLVSRIAAVTLVLAGSTVARAAGEEQAFIAENNAAMDRMMMDMHVAPTGDVDRDFVAMMIPHHQGAIAMAQAELRYGQNPQLKRLAQSIISAQTREIAIMRQAVGTPAVAPTTRGSIRPHATP